MKLLPAMVALALVSSALIFGREVVRSSPVSFVQILLWQVAIWSPWAAAPPIIGKLSQVLAGRSHPVRRVALAAAGCGLVVIHIVWSVWISASFSPLRVLPNTNFGVYAYFFIFWAIVDLVILWSILQAAHINARVEATGLANTPDRLMVRVDGITRFIEVEKISWISAEDYYAKLHTDDGDLIVRYALKALLEKLPEARFLQIHRSAIVNIGRIAAIETRGNQTFVVMEDGLEVAVSRGRKRILKARLRKPV